MDYDSGGLYIIWIKDKESCLSFSLRDLYNLYVKRVLIIVFPYSYLVNCFCNKQAKAISSLDILVFKVVIRYLGILNKAREDVKLAYIFLGLVYPFRASSISKGVLKQLKLGYRLLI